MPTVQEILTQVQTQFPNSFTNDQLLVWGNEILHKIWKFMNEDDIYSFDTIANQPTYSLPSDGLDLDKISVITIATDSSLENFTEYYYKGLLDNKEASNYFYDSYNGTFGIYPIPTESITDGGRIFYGPKFALMSSSDLTATPRVNEDYHSLIVNYICMKAAASGSNPNTDVRNIFASDFNDDWDRFMYEWISKKCKLPQKNKANKWW